MLVQVRNTSRALQPERTTGSRSWNCPRRCDTPPAARVVVSQSTSSCGSRDRVMASAVAALAGGLGAPGSTNGRTQPERGPGERDH
jgi:hypothetical protein